MYYAESDGYRCIDVWVNVDPPPEFDMLSKEVILAIADKMPLNLWIRDPHGRDGKVVWMDEEYVSLDYGSGYIVWKRTELP
jgi:hypothetical protein